MLTPPLTAIGSLIFDLDGTLIDSKQDLIHSVNAMLGEIGRAKLPPATIASFIGDGAPQLVRRSLGESASEEENKRALQFFLGYYEDHKMDTTIPYPGVAETLAELAHLPMAVLTNKPVRISVRILDAMGLSKYFRCIYGGNSFETKKPDPLGANTILREMGAMAADSLFVGDSQVDVLTARNAGMIAAAVNYGFGNHDRTAYPADVYLEQFSDLSALITSPRV